MDSLQRSLFRSSGRKTDHETIEATRSGNHPSHDADKKDLATKSSQGFAVDRSLKSLPRTPSKLERILPTHKPSQEERIIKRFVLDSSQTQSSRSNPTRTEGQETLGSSGKKTFAKGIRHSFLGLLGRHREEDKDGNLGTPVRRRDDQASQRQIRSMGVSFEHLKGLEHGNDDIVARKRNASMIELNIGHP